MGLKLFIAFLTGSISYIIIVLTGLIYQHSLTIIFYRGLLSFFIIGVLGWLFIFTLEKFSKKDDRNFEEISEDINKQEEENFSPLNPPVLETREEEE